MGSRWSPGSTTSRELPIVAQRIFTMVRADSSEAVPAMSSVGTEIARYQSGESGAEHSAAKSSGTLVTERSRR